MLVQLEYMNLISFTVVDPLHNLWLGTAKYFFKNILCETLSETQLLEVQAIVDNTKMPSDLGSIPLKIASGFCSFTANQWEIWTMYYALACLYNRVDQKVYNVWRLIVEACHLYCKPVISVLDVKCAHEQIMTFCREFEKLYSSKRVTCNMHLHTHLIENILSFGPVQVFWLYSLQRSNGVLSGFSIAYSPDI
jgi:hypothetical protein